MTHKRELHLPTEDIYARLAGIGCSLAVEPQCFANFSYPELWLCSDGDSIIG